MLRDNFGDTQRRKRSKECTVQMGHVIMIEITINKTSI